MSCPLSEILPRRRGSVEKDEHDMNLVSQTSNRVMAVADGAVIAIGEPAEIQNHPDVLRAYLGD